MDPILRSIQEDRSAGLQADVDGRTWFRQRRVRFTTIRFSPEDLLAGGWGGFPEALHPLAWEPAPELPEMRVFAAEASRRFLTFWYRCIDVMVARSLFGRDRRIFQVPFFEGSLFSDTGIADDQRLSAVQPGLHARILADYATTRHIKTRFSIHYLSGYLEGITDDLREALSPLHALWAEEEERQRLLDEPERLCSHIAQRLLSRAPGGLLRDALLAEIDRRLGSVLDALHSHLGAIADAELRRLVHRRHQDAAAPLNMRERRTILSWDGGPLAEPGKVMGERAMLQDALDLIELPATLERTTRRAFYYATRRLQEGLLSLRHAKTTSARERHEAAEDRLRGAIVDLQNLVHDVERRRLLPRLDGMARSWEGSADPTQSLLALTDSTAGRDPGPTTRATYSPVEDSAEDWMPEPLQGSSRRSSPESPRHSLQNSRPESSRLLRRLVDLPAELHAVDGRILAFHAIDSTVHRDGPLLDSDPRYPPAPFPQEWHPARDQATVLNTAREILNQRLRVVRRTASGYSLRPGDRHGILTLNPVLRLWKDRSSYERGLPALAGREINTPDVVECLTDLAILADPELADRQVQSSEIVRNRHGARDLDHMRFFLIPGSCAPVREVEPQDFPEFRHRVIGDVRSPHESGIDREEGILTGAWYRKDTHTLYYPVGGDNSHLLSILWKAGRSEGVCAFFFALGQFVHDCYEDRKIYYRLGEPTFREAVEDYYRAYEKRKKTRDERSGRRRSDNSRAGVRFMFAVFYSRYIMEALTGTNQGAFRHAATEEWFARHTRIPLIARSDRTQLRALRQRTRERIDPGGSADG